MRCIGITIAVTVAAITTAANAQVGRTDVFSFGSIYEHIFDCSGAILITFLFALLIIGVASYSNSRVRQKTKRLTQTSPVEDSDYDETKWNVLVAYDDDLAAAEREIQPLGQEWVDELARSYLLIGDKTYLSKIVIKIQNAAKKSNAPKKQDADVQSEVASKPHKAVRHRVTIATPTQDETRSPFDRGYR